MLVILDPYTKGIFRVHGGQGGVQVSRDNAPMLPGWDYLGSGRWRRGAELDSVHRCNNMTRRQGWFNGIA